MVRLVELMLLKVYYVMVFWQGQVHIIFTSCHL